MKFSEFLLENEVLKSKDDIRNAINKFDKEKDSNKPTLARNILKAADKIGYSVRKKEILKYNNYSVKNSNRNIILFNDKFNEDFNKTIMKNFDFNTYYDLLEKELGSGKMKIHFNPLISKCTIEFSSNIGNEICRTFYLDKKLVYHDTFGLIESFQNRGISKKILAFLYDEYKKIGINKIELFAACENGGYTWAKYGFAATRQSVYDLLDKTKDENITNKLETLLKKYKYDVVMKEIAELTDSTGNKIGKDFLVGKAWDGILFIDNKEQINIFEEYLNGK